MYYKDNPYGVPSYPQDGKFSRTPKRYMGIDNGLMPLPGSWVSYMKNPWVIAGIVAVVILLLVLIFSGSSKENYSYHLMN